jgi:deoxyadenosine/deoxycytidine kinase
MGKLVTIIGNAGSGKTTLTRVICERAGYIPFLEQHAERPFQAAFQNDLRSLSFPNQVDYLLYRAEQEWTIRAGKGIGVQDGGLDQDYHIFTRLFRQNNYLSESEFGLCKRLFGLLRKSLPLPDCIIKLNVPIDILIERRKIRDRKIDIAGNSDLPRIELLFQDWFSTARPPCPILEIDPVEDDLNFTNSIEKIMNFINAIKN